MNSTRNLTLIIFALHVGRIFACDWGTTEDRQLHTLRLRKNKNHHRSDSESTYLPYFGGAEGISCVNAAIEQMKRDEMGKNKLDKLLAIMQTDLYREAAARCGPEIELYSRAAGLVCLLEEESNYNTTYAKFWLGGVQGYVLYQGDLDLATMFEYTKNFTVFGTDISCLADCYTKQGTGCDSLTAWLPYSGTIGKQQYCSLKWSEIDIAYTALRVCASKAIANPSDGTTKEEYVRDIEANQMSSNSCGFNYCASN